MSAHAGTSCRHRAAAALAEDTSFDSRISPSFSLSPFILLSVFLIISQLRCELK